MASTSRTPTGRGRGSWGGGSSSLPPPPSTLPLTVEEFFIVINEDPLAKKALPKKFANYLDGQEPAKVYLRAADCGPHLWTVEVLSDGQGQIYLDKGWENFAIAHGVDFGCFLHFKYEGDDVLTVKVFDGTICRKYYYTDNEDTDDESDDDVLPDIRGAQLFGLLDGSMPEPEKELKETDKDGKEVKIPSPGYAQWIAADQTVLSYLVRNMSRDVLTQMVGLTSAPHVVVVVVHVVDSVVVVVVILISADMSAVMSSSHNAMSSVVISIEAMDVAMVAVETRDDARIMAVLGPFASSEDDDDVPLSKRAKPIYATVDAVVDFADQFTRVESENVQLRKVVKTSADQVLEANGLTAEVQSENTCLKDELKKLKKKMKDEQEARHKAFVEADKKEGALRESIRILLSTADMPVDCTNKLRVDSMSDALTFATESGKQIKDLLVKTKGALLRLFLMMFPKLDQNKTLREMADTFFIDSSDAIEVLKRSRLYGAVLTFQLLMGHGLGSELEKLSEALPVDANDCLVNLEPFKQPALLCANRLLKLVDEGKKKAASGAVPSSSAQTSTHI
ncbi:hypothetical protein QYE76_064896 [Lolium multiflorum]|uniref:TF-B3 domain-containing protein n=1 Tax=Lolium multiflorum TaxID=4521 RepID=A0AAD8S7E8_LOLMU|nr:hypothetical protein QYE76_064896 [Lolium multiflorum]